MKIRHLTITAITATILSTACTQRAGGNDLILFTGSYSPADSAGIRTYAFNQSTGEISPLGQASGVSNPSFITVDTRRRLIYAVGEDAGTSSTANILAYSPDATAITLLQSAPTHGAAPCHIAISPDSSTLLTANYLGGSISVFPLNSDGMFADTATTIRFQGHGPDSIRQAQPHLHQITFLPGTNTLMANDLGTDRIYTIPAPYTTSPVTTTTAPAGSGPRHTAYHPAGNFAYTLTEISGEILVWSITTPTPTLIQTILADSLHAAGSADIHISPDGQFLYASNRLAGDGIAIFSIDPLTGRLTHTGYQSTGIHPRNFLISPNGKFILVACRDTNAIEIYRRDPATGALTLSHTISTPSPTCLLLP